MSEGIDMTDASDMCDATGSKSIFPTVVGPGGTHFVYRPLQSALHIRVLLLTPGGLHDPLRGELRHLKLETSHEKSSTRRSLYSGFERRARSFFVSKKVSYEALSYVWGQPMQGHFIYCPRGKIAITPNLEQALLHVRLSDRTRALWVDAICINQANLLERSHQVSLMGSIYAKAQQVLVWLGPDLCNIAESTFDALRSLIQPPYLIVADELVRPHMEEVGKSEWFTRLWVVQEFSMAKRAIAVWGHAQINFIYFQAPWSRWLLDRDFHGPRWCARKAWGFQTALRFTGALQCSDPRDRIYAILALSRNDPLNFRDKIEHLVPDYSKSVTQLFFEVACIFVESGNIQQLLSDVSHAHFLGRTATRLPSWIPNWGHWTQHEPLSALYKGVGVAEGLSLVAPAINYQKRFLTVSGITADQVTHSAAHSLLMSDVSLAVNNIASFWAEHIKSIKTPVDLDKPPETIPVEIRFLQSLLYLDKINQSLDPRQRLATQLFAPLNSDGPVKDILQILSMVPMAMEMLQSLAMSLHEYYRNGGDLNTDGSAGHRYWRNRKLFITKNGYIGLGPSALQPRDTLAVISGLKSSVILRKNEDHYTFVGTAYVPSICNGEVVQRSKINGNKIETFELR